MPRPASDSAALRVNQVSRPRPMSQAPPYCIMTNPAGPSVAPNRDRNRCGTSTEPMPKGTDTTVLAMNRTLSFMRSPPSTSYKEPPHQNVGRINPCAVCPDGHSSRPRLHPP